MKFFIFFSLTLESPLLAAMCPKPDEGDLNMVTPCSQHIPNCYVGPLSLAL
jgi:hypothetical protein